MEYAVIDVACPVLRTITESFFNLIDDFQILVFLLDIFKFLKLKKRWFHSHFGHKLSAECCNYAG
jgi:hypothetical protein